MVLTLHGEVISWVGAAAGVCVKLYFGNKVFRL